MTPLSKRDRTDSLVQKISDLAAAVLFLWLIYELAREWPNDYARGYMDAIHDVWGGVARGSRS